MVFALIAAPPEAATPIFVLSISCLLCVSTETAETFVEVFEI